MIEPCVVEAEVDALRGGRGGESSRQQSLTASDASVAVGTSGSACRPTVAAINCYREQLASSPRGPGDEAREQQDDGKLSDSEHGDVRTEKPRRYPYAAMFFIMTAVVGQRLFIKN